MTKRQELVGNTLNLNAIFVLPMVGLNYKNLPQNFINSYISTNEEQNYTVCIVFGKIIDYDDIIFIDFLEIVKKSSQFLQIEQTIDEIIITFIIPPYQRDNFNLFLKGKYSKFSDDYKKRLVTFYKVKTIKESYEVTEYNTIYPQDFKRKQIAEMLGVDVKMIDEVLDIPNLDKEIYKTIEQLEEQSIYDKG